MKAATRFKLANDCRSNKTCKQWVREMKKNPLVEDEILRLIEVCTAHDIGRVIEKEIIINTAQSAVLYAITQSPNKFIEIIISFKRNNLNEWDGWENKSNPVIKTYRLEEKHR